MFNLLETKLACGSRDVLNTAHFTLENWRFQEHRYCISTWTQYGLLPYYVVEHSFCDPVNLASPLGNNKINFPYGNENHCQIKGNFQTTV